MSKIRITVILRYCIFRKCTLCLHCVYEFLCFKSSFRIS